MSPPLYSILAARVLVGKAIAAALNRVTTDDAFEQVAHKVEQFNQAKSELARAVAETAASILDRK